MQSLMASFGVHRFFATLPFARGLFLAVAIGSGEAVVFVVVDDRMVTFGTVVHRRERTGRL